MVGRTAAEAVNRYQQLMHGALACISGAVLTVRGGYHVTTTPHQLLVGSGPIPLRGETPVVFSPLEHYRIIREARTYRVGVVAAFYTIWDEQDREILAYHWHPDGSSRVTTPHLHLGHWSAAGLENLPRAHLITGPVTMPAVIRMLIEEFGIPPLREDWSDVLAEAERATSR